MCSPDTAMESSINAKPANRADASNVKLDCKFLYFGVVVALQEQIYPERILNLYRRDFLNWPRVSRTREDDVAFNSFGREISQLLKFNAIHRVWIVYQRWAHNHPSLSSIGPAAVLRYG